MVDISGVEPNVLAQTAGGIAVAIIGAILTVQKVLKSWKADSAETNIINIVNDQIERMSKTNNALMTEVSKLQSEIIELNRELRNLSSENQRLRNEVKILTDEVNHLHGLLSSSGTNK